MGWGRLGDGGGILLVDKLKSVPFNRIWMACLKAGTVRFGSAYEEGVEVGGGKGIFVLSFILFFFF